MRFSSINRLTVPVLSLLLLSFIASCASPPFHFEALPTRQEFKKPLSELVKQYPSLTEYSNSFKRSFAATFALPDANDMIKVWGEPDDTSISLWSLLTDPIEDPITRWYWQIENKKISTLIDHPFIFGYAPCVRVLQVTEIEKTVEPMEKVTQEPVKGEESKPAEQNQH